MSTRRPRLSITRGLPASGKTTWAREALGDDPTTTARVNRDDLRAMLFHKPTYQFEQEELVTRVQRAAVRELLDARMDVVADDTNLRAAYVRAWRRFARAHSADFVVRDFDVDPEECIARDAARAHPVGEKVIRGMTRFLRDGHLPPIPEETPDDPPEAYVPDETKPAAVIVDIDGTVALMGDRNPYDLSRVGDDVPNLPVVRAVHAAYSLGAEVIFLSGREDACTTPTGERVDVMALTRAWLDRHVGLPYELYMRPAEDKRRDAIVKRELFDTHVRTRFQVLYVLDDRQQVVDMWRGLGLTCMQVAPGDF